MDVTGCQNDFSEGECVLLAKAEQEEGRKGTDGIVQIQAADDEYVWAATGSASVRRWRDVGRKRDRLEAAVPGSDRRGSLGGFVQIPPQTQQYPSTAEGTPIKNKRLSLEPGMDGSLARVESRENRSVAFAPIPTRDRGDEYDPLDSTRAQSAARKTTASGAAVAGSIYSVASSRTGGAEYTTGKNGIAYAHLVCLGLPETPYASGTFNNTTTNGDSGPNAYSMSLASFRRPSVPSVAPSGPSGRLPSIASYHGKDAPEPADVARRDFEDREIVLEADPLRQTPDEIIKGRHGLIRALMLNDRQHALTIDTGGQVAVWNVINGRCVGRYSSKDISGVYQGSGAGHSSVSDRDSLETLDIVRERIEGESSTVTWCTIDTRIGSLTVHVEENRCFDAEAYADEVGYANDPEFREDQRSECRSRRGTSL